MIFVNIVNVIIINCDYVSRIRLINKFIDNINNYDNNTYQNQNK